MVGKTISIHYKVSKTINAVYIIRVSKITDLGVFGRYCVVDNYYPNCQLNWVRWEGGFLWDDVISLTVFTNENLAPKPPE